MVLSKNGNTLWAVSPGYGRAVAIDVRARKVAKAFRIQTPMSNQGRGTRAALSPDGKRIALSDGDTVSVLDLGKRKIVKSNHQFALALGYAPDGSLRMFS
jgi:DNA-binding beta-propeller fold protein YncE